MSDIATTKHPRDADVKEDGSPSFTARRQQTISSTETPKYTDKIPEISEVDLHERLEKVGEVMSIMDRVVIVKGLPSSIANRGSETALDSDTLLVFEDRKVLGYVSSPSFQRICFAHL